MAADAAQVDVDMNDGAGGVGEKAGTRSHNVASLSGEAGLETAKQPVKTTLEVVRVGSSQRNEKSTERVDNLLPVQFNDVGKSTGANAFAQFVQGWESYISDDSLIDPFPNFQQPLQMLQGLSLCGHQANDFSGLSLKRRVHDLSALAHPSAPSVLRHTHSSPSQINGRSTSVFGNHPFAEDDSCPPPPIALDPFQRSTSTPSAFRQHSNYSAFGTGDGSAFTLTSPRYSGISSMGRDSTSYSAFGPVQFYSMALETMEQTSIEVQDISDRRRNDTDESLCKQKAGSKRGAASRAVKFLSDVRVLRRRRRARGGRENPAQPASVSSGSKFGDEDMDDEHEATRPLDTAVTVVTETVFNPNDTSFLSGSSEISALVKETEQDLRMDCEDEVCTNLEQKLANSDEAKDELPQSPQQYHQLDSDVEEEVGYQRIETQLQSDSPPIPTPANSCFAAKNLNIASADSTDNRAQLRVHVSSSQKPRFTMAMESEGASPSPTRMERVGEGNTLTPFSLEAAATSPHTTRSSFTGSSSGHTTQATITSFNTGLQSGLSTISETDREVMQANKDAKRRRGLDSLTTTRKTETDGSSNNSSSSNSTNPHRYFSLASSPVPLRDGANVPVDRFFTASPSNARSVGLPLPLQLAHIGTSSPAASRRSGSTSSESLPITHTSSSAASSNGEMPPTFVSYLDREASSDLTSFREAMETSSLRATENDLEKREASPASEMMIYPELSFEEPTTSSHVRGARLDKFRSRQRPPRSPGKGTRSAKTPPPQGSISPLYHQQISPPRTIVGHLESEVSRPNVMRRCLSSSTSAVAGQSLDTGDWRLSNPSTGVPVFRMGLTSVDLGKHRTYKESSIEVMNSNVGDKATSNLPAVTPEK